MATDRPVVFLGPSMRRETARAVLDADYRPPARRGDLDAIAAGTVVGLIDGVFDQDLAVSLREVHDAADRGVVVFGGASMGALRAAEVPRVIGVGTIYQWYRSERITRDDEVALLFDEGSGRAVTVPTVNVRYAVERLTRMGTIDHPTGCAILDAARSLHFRERTYRAILRRAGIGGQADADDLAAMLEAHDLKHLDAQAVLEAMARHRAEAPAGPGAGRPVGAGPDPIAAASSAAAEGDVFIWESGDRVAFTDLVRFLGFTGSLGRVLRDVVAQGALAGSPPARPPAAQQATQPGGEAQAVFVAAVRRWGWVSAEEAEVTLCDLGLPLEALDRHIATALDAAAVVSAHARAGEGELLDALRCQLFLDEMGLKRAAMRLAGLRHFAARATTPAEPHERREAWQVLCRANREMEPAAVRRAWEGLGLGDAGAQDAFVEQLALARRAGRAVADRMTGRAVAGPPPDRVPTLALSACPKPAGEARFCLPAGEAHAHAQRLRQVIGVTRIGLIGELSDLAGVQVAQVARPGGAWSSSYGSGKALTEEGAIVGGVMEELEKWSQERFAPDPSAVRHGSYAELRGDDRVVSPATLDLPHDSIYRPDVPLRWYPCADLLTGGEAFLPVDVVTMQRQVHDICFSARGARKHLATNGLGSGFTREEAVLHAVCEYVERHALRLAELVLANPGSLGPHAYRFVDLTSLPGHLGQLAERLARGGAVVRVLDITADVAVPTFLAVIIRDGQRAEGSGTHPHPETAVEMALLEAAQTISSSVAGAREDLSIRARSLGRHERPRPVSIDDTWWWLDPDAVAVPIGQVDGHLGGDVREDVRWVLERLRRAGVERCAVLDLTRPEVAPAHVVRVVVPGLETNNPFFTGERARLVLLRDLLPRWR